MLAYILALAVGLGSLAVFMAAFFFPEIHRKNDFIWSGLGLFYALVLWVCAGRISGGLLLGQVAGVALLGWSVPQMFLLRRELTPRQQQTQIPSTEEVKKTIDQKVSNLSIPQRISQLGDRLSNTATGAKDKIQQQLQRGSQSKVATSTPTPQPKVEVVDHRTPVPEAPVESATTTEPPASTEKEPEIAAIAEPPALTEEEAIAQAVEAAKNKPENETAELVRPNPPTPELVEAAIRDAEEKLEEASPPEPAGEENT